MDGNRPPTSPFIKVPLQVSWFRLKYCSKIVINLYEDCDKLSLSVHFRCKLGSLSSCVLFL